VAVVLVALGTLGLASLGVGVAAVLDAREPGGPDAVEPAAPAAVPTSPRAAEARERPGGPTTSVAREVLREWDRRREAAWTSADPDVLAALYLPDSVAGRRDVALLRRWRARGIDVSRLQPQVLELEVLRDTRRTLVLRVTDRLTMAASVAGEPLDLPQDRATTRRIELRRGPDVASPWRVVAVRGALGAPASLEG
jgi:hypothetical protein